MRSSTGGTTIGATTVSFSLQRSARSLRISSIGANRRRSVIGDENQIREFATMHIGTEGGGGTTSVGNRNLFMNFSHVAHDCTVGNRVVLANGATLAGHVTFEDYVIVGGLAAVHQFVRLGESSMLGGGAIVVQDVPPFCVVQGDRAGLVGSERRGLAAPRAFPDEELRALRAAYRTLFRSGLTAEEAIRKLREEAVSSAAVDQLVAFVESTKRGLCRLRGEARETTPTPSRDGHHRTHCR